jgi:hypothetical protein
MHMAEHTARLKWAEGYAAQNAAVFGCVLGSKMPPLSAILFVFFEMGIISPQTVANMALNHQTMGFKPHHT